MTTNNELPPVDRPNKILFLSVSSKLNAIHSEISSFSYPPSTPCIYKVSNELRQLNKSAYNPSVVSIGPIHNNNDDDEEEQNLKAMEHIKLAYTRDLLLRIAGKSAPERENGMDQALLECSTAMIDLEDVALNCYAENLKPTIKKKNREHRLAEMLLIDGCFILEFLYRSFLVETRQLSPEGDPLFGNSMIMPGIRHDLLLLENQLPFFILKELFSKTIENIPDRPWSSRPTLTQFVLSFFGDMMTFNSYDIQSTSTNPEDENCFHILHLLHSCYLPRSPDLVPIMSQFSHCASDLGFAGVVFVPGTAGIGQFDVNFKEASGLLWWYDTAKFEIPPLSIDDFTEPYLRNLIAFEQCCCSIRSRPITSYAYLMDSLINSAADFELLEKAKIMHNYLPASEDASVLFNNICKYTELKMFDFAKPRNDAENHCRRLWPAFLAVVKRDNLALLKRNYFSNPWSGIAVFAAIILFALAVVQTVYTILTYYGEEYGTVRELYDTHSVL